MPATGIRVNLLKDSECHSLLTAIQSTNEARLREVLADFVFSDNALAPAISRALFEALVTTRENQGNVEAGGSNISQKRQLIARWEVCARCGVEYDAGEEHEEDECNYHSGELIVNEEEFVDWDEDCHGPMNTKQNRKDFPENFIWTCCDEDGRSDGCESGEHQAGGRKAKRKRTE
ncbi:unnamed protein product [Somion occarium]|uniref:Uncharacterized protein n=1 Tax=Somion occarium TaxID=3059160 RepID=A0ABP1EAM3_9APHY